MNKEPVDQPTTLTKARRHRRRTRISLSVCDDCCCGTIRKHPGVDHAGIRQQLADAATSVGGRSRSVGCLGVCARSNVVVVRTPDAGTFWVGEVLDDLLVGSLASWIGDGAPLPVPDIIDLHVFERHDPASTPPPSPVTQPIAEPINEPVAEFVTLGRRGPR